MYCEIMKFNFFPEFFPLQEQKANVLVNLISFPWEKGFFLTISKVWCCTRKIKSHFIKAWKLAAHNQKFNIFLLATCWLLNRTLSFALKASRISHKPRVSVQGVKSLGSHFACLCRGFEFYEIKKKLVLFFKKKMEILLHF